MTFFNGCVSFLFRIGKVTKVRGSPETEIHRRRKKLLRFDREEAISKRNSNSTTLGRKTFLPRRYLRGYLSLNIYRRYLEV